MFQESLYKICTCWLNNCMKKCISRKIPVRTHSRTKFNKKIPQIWFMNFTKCMQFPLKKKRKKYCSFCFFLLQCNYVMLGNFFLNERTIAIRLSWKTLCIFSRQNGTRQKWQELLDIIRQIAFQHHFTKTVCPIHILASRNRRVDHIKSIKGKSTQKN